MNLYADGGVIKKNPSALGGTWAFALVWQGELVWQDSGTYTPQRLQVEKVTNNHMELIALLKGLNYCYKHNIDVHTVYSDSNVSLGRLFRGWAMNNVPLWLVKKKEEIMKHYYINAPRWQLLDGHPTKKQLKRGKGKKGHPVSRWNVLCDKLCNEEAVKFLS